MGTPLDELTPALRVRLEGYMRRWGIEDGASGTYDASADRLEIAHPQGLFIKTMLAEITKKGRRLRVLRANKTFGDFYYGGTH
jgi:hypothetical protein